MEVNRTEIMFQGDLTFAQFALIQKSMLPWWASYYISFPFLLYWILLKDRDWNTFTSHPYSVLPDAIFLIILLVGMPVLNMYFRRNAWRDSVKLNGPINGKINDFGIEWHTAHAVNNFPWEKFLKVREVPSLILIYYSPRCALYFPKTFFINDTDWELFRSLVFHKVPNVSPPKKATVGHD